MKINLKNIRQNRGVKIGFEIVLVIVLYFGIKTFMQRDLVAGAPPFVQETLLDGQSVNLQDYKGKPLLLHFWATWCSVCKLEEAMISDLSQDYAVITIAMNSGSNHKIKAYLEQNNLTFPVVVDQNSQIANRFGVRGVPTSFVINPDGNIEYTEVGYTTGWGLRFRMWLAQ